MGSGGTPLQELPVRRSTWELKEDKRIIYTLSNQANQIISIA